MGHHAREEGFILSGELPGVTYIPMQHQHERIMLSNSDTAAQKRTEPNVTQRGFEVSQRHGITPFREIAISHEYLVGVVLQVEAAAKSRVWIATDEGIVMSPVSLRFAITRDPANGGLIVLPPQ